LNEPLILFQLCFDSLLLGYILGCSEYLPRMASDIILDLTACVKKFFAAAFQYDAVIEIERLTRFDRIADARIDYGMSSG